MDREADRSVEHLPLEEVRLSDVSVTAPPAGWAPGMESDGPHPPPVLVQDTGGLTLVGNHNTFWRAASMSRTTIRCLVVRSAVHVGPAHESISNAGEEPLLFQGLLAAGIVENRSRLADMLGFSRARITQVLNLLKLPLELRREVLADNTITEYQLRPLIRIEGADQQLAMFRELQSKRLTGRQMALYANSAPATPAEKGKPPDPVPEPDPVSTADELEAAFSQAQPPVAPQNRDRAPARPDKDSTPPRFTSADETPSREILKILPRLGTLREKEWRSVAAEAGVDKLDMRFLEGVSLLRRGMFADSLDTLSDVIRRSPDYSAAWYFMGKCANLTGALTDAEEYLRNAIERDPKQPDFYLELAVVLEKQKRDTEALTLFRKANSIRRSKRSNEKV